MKDADGFITKEQFLAAVDAMKQEGSGGDQAGSDSAATTKDKWGRMPGEAAADIGAYQLKDHLEMTFPMYAISISTLMAMEKMRNFEDLRATGELEEWNKSKGPVFFLSHQWTSFDEPDHTGTQLRTAQEIVPRLISCTFSKALVLQSCHLGPRPASPTRLPLPPFNHPTTPVDMFDHFYMLGQINNTVFNGNFACCSLGHKKTFADGTEIVVPCDKLRFKCFWQSIWQRKCNHFAAAGDFIKHLFAFRYITHMKLMMADEDGDTPSNTEDNLVTSLDDILDKYWMRDASYKPIMTFVSGISKGLIMEHPLNKETPEGLPAEDCPPHPSGPFLSLEANLAEYAARGDRVREALGRDGDAGLVNHALFYMVAEGNLAMVKLLVEEHGAEATFPVPWCQMTLLDYAVGKGFGRLARYLLEHGAAAEVNRFSNREGICAVDRAAKSGSVDCLRLLVEHGADVVGVKRRNGQTPAHGAAMGGHLAALKALKELGLDMLAKDVAGRTALDLARYYFQTETVEWLAGLEPPP